MRLARWTPDERAVLMRAAIDIIAIDRSLRRSGYATTFCRTETPHRLAARVRRLPVHRIAQIVDTAARYAIGFERSCLRRSILLVWLLRSAGVECDLVSGIGRRDGDWRGHAWVEIDGHPINDRRDLSVFSQLRGPLSRRQSTAGTPSANSAIGPSSS